MKSIITNILLIVSVIILASCGKDEDGFRTYTVKAGKEYSCHGLGVNYNKKSVQFWFESNDSWTMGYNGGINKIAGIGWAWDHHENSCRLGHKYISGEDVYFMYVYADGEAIRFQIDVLPRGRHYCDIGRVGDEWHLTLNGKTHICKAGKDYKTGTKLFPNKKKSDKDWVVKIKWE